MDLLRKYFVSSTDSNELKEIDIVEKLVDRFNSSTRIDDKRDSLRTLKALSKKYRLEVGTLAMNVFLTALESHRSDPDSVCYSLEALFAVMNDDNNGLLESHELINIPTDLGAQFTEIFIKKVSNVELILSYLDAVELYIRRNAIRLLNIFLINRLKDAQTVVLQCPMGISKIVDILSEPREVLRNDIILLLLELTKSHTTIQKIVAFENAFERIMLVIDSEGLCDGGVVVEDCLRLLHQLLKGNASNQILFREGNFIQRLLRLVDLNLTNDSELHNWSAQKVVNVQLVLQIIKSLVSPNNKSQITRLCQSVISDCGLFGKLCNIVMANGVPADVLTKAIYTVADVVRGCPANQEFLNGIIAPSDPPQSAITVLLLSMVNERQTLDVRMAVLYCFQCYLTLNRQAQRKIVMSLLPKSCEAATISDGQLLCGGLFSNDGPSTWFSAIALLHCIHDNLELKEELLRVHLTSGQNCSPVALLQQCFTSLQQSNQFQIKVGLLQLLCTWLAYCPVVVRRFLQSPIANSNKTDENSNVFSGTNLSILVADAATVDNDESELLVRGLTTLLICICVIFNPGDVVGYDKETLINTLEKRIGIDIILERLNQITKAESFIFASKKLEPHSSSDLIFDYTFTRLFKRLEYDVMRTFQPTNYEVVDSSTLQSDHRLITQYEQKLSKQQNEIQMLRDRINMMECELSKFRSDRNQKIYYSYSDNAISDSPKALREKLEDTENKIRLLERSLNIAEQEKISMRNEQDDLLVLLHDQDMKLQSLCELVKQLGGEVPEEFNEVKPCVSPVLNSCADHNNEMGTSTSNER